MSKRAIILVLGGGYDQCALIKKLKGLGYTVFLADYLEKPIAAQYADRHFIISTLDTKQIKKLCIDYNIERIAVACTDQALLTAASVSEKLGLPFYLSAQTTRQLTNKKYMKAQFVKYAIPTARHIVTKQSHLRELPAWDFPWVVKPADCNSSKGITKIENLQALAPALEYALETSRSHTAIIEEFIPGKELSIDVYVVDGKATLLSVTETVKIANNTDFTIIQSKYPAAISADCHSSITELVQTIADAFKLTNCPLLIQAIYTKDRLSIIEISARLGGGTKYRLIEEICGVPAMDANIATLLGTPYAISPQTKRDTYIRLNYCYCYNGLYTQHTLEQLKQNATIAEYYPYKAPGSQITGARTSSDRIAGYLITAHTEEELQQKQQCVMEQLQVTGENGVNIARTFQYE